MELPAPPPLKVFSHEGNSAQDIAHWCSEEEYIGKVLALSNTELKVFNRFRAVYVISPEDIPVSKVGVAVDPYDRLCGLQGGNWNKLYVRSLFWCGEGAFELERAVLNKLSEFGVRLEGEWAGIEAEDMALLVAQCVKETKSQIAGSKLFLSNWVEYSALATAERYMKIRPKAMERRQAGAARLKRQAA